MSLHDEREMRGADVGNDYCLVSAFIKLILLRVTPKSNIKRFNAGKLCKNKVK